MAVFNKFRKSVFGYDIFISYSRKDSLDYAYAVAQYFMRKGYECYIDQLSSIAPGQKLPPNIKEAVKRSSAFVVIGSEGAQSSEPIRDEINLFLNNNKNKPLIPVTIEGAINDNSIWFERIRGLALIDDSKTNLESSTPAQDVLDRIENALKFTKKSARLRNTALVTLLSVVAIVVGITLYAQAKVRKAVDEVAKAGEKVALANKLTVQAETKQKNAEAKVAQANVKLGQLNSQLKGVLQQYQSEKKKVNEVKVELKNAGQQKVAMELLAKKNKALADEYDKVAFARNLASEAFFEKEENPQLAALKVLFAVKQFQGKPKIDPLVEKAFRTIATSQTGIAVRPFKKEIKAVCISPDMNYAAVADHYGEVAVFAVKNKSDAILKLDLNEEEPAYRLFFDAASQYLMAVKGKDDSPKKTLTIFDLSETEGSKDFRRDFDCLTAAINKDLNTVAFVDTTFNVFEISLDGNTSIIPKPLFKLENAETATNLEFSDDNRKVAIGLSNSLVELWDINRPSQPLRTIHANHRSTDDSSDLAIGTLRFTHDDKYLLTGTERRFATDQDDTLKLWPIDDALALPKKYVNEYGPFDTFIFDSVISSINIDGKILTWGISSESSSGVDSIGTHNVGDDGIREGLFSNDGNRVLLSDEGGKVLLLQKENDKFLEKSRFYYSPAPVTAFDLSRDGSFIVSGDNEGVVKITQTAKGNEAVIKLNGLGRKIADVRTSSDYGRVVIEGDENTGRLGHKKSSETNSAVRFQT